MIKREKNTRIYRVLRVPAGTEAKAELQALEIAKRVVDNPAVIEIHPAGYDATDVPFVQYVMTGERKGA